MIENYFEKYHFLREPKKQMVKIESQLKYDKRLYLAYEKDIKKWKEKLKETSDKSDIQKTEDIIEKSQRKHRELENEIKRIEDGLKQIDVIRSSKADYDLFKGKKIEDDKISDIYFAIRAKQQTTEFERHNEEISMLPESEEKRLKKETLKNEIKEFANVYYILGNAERRNTYLQKLAYQEYKDYLEENRLARLEEEKNQVLKILGSDFNPDMHEYDRNSKGYSWNVDLYDKPEELFVGSTNFSKIPQIDKEIFARRYGIFEYGTHLNKDGKPTYSDSTCEIIGVTKRDKDGRINTNFVIAPLRYMSGLTSKRLQTEGKKVIHSSLTTSEKVFNKIRKKILDTIYPNENTKNSNPFRGKVSKNSREGNKITYFPKEKYVLVPNISKYEVSKEDREFFGNIYLSDYLTNNAVENNAGFLGTYDFQNKKKSITFDKPMDEETVQACYFAKKNPGMISKKIGSKKRSMEIRNIDELFDNLRVTQYTWAKEQMKKMVDREER